MFQIKKPSKKILLGQDNNVLMWLFGTNASLFILFGFLKVALIMTGDNLNVAYSDYYNNILNNFVLSSDVHAILRRPWTLLTYIFMHDSIWQLLNTVIWSWGFGSLMQNLSGNKRILPLYIYGGLVAGVVYLLASIIFPSAATYYPYGYTLTGGASVMAIAMATVGLVPNYRMFPNIGGGIKLWILGILYVILDLSSLGVDHIAEILSHAFAGAFGLLFSYQLKKGHDWSDGINRFWDWLSNLFNPETKSSNLRVVSKNEGLFYNAERPPFKKIPNSEEERLNTILDKIHSKGMEALSKEEKDFLTYMSDKK